MSNMDAAVSEQMIANEGSENLSKTNQTNQLLRLQHAGSILYDGSDNSGFAKERKRSIASSRLVESKIQNGLKKESSPKIAEATKKGVTHKHLTEKQEEEFLNYKMLTDLFDFEMLKQSKNFHVKRYKDSLYRGEIENKKRHGLGICCYEIGRIYEGSWH